VTSSVTTVAPQGLDRAARARMSEIQRARLLAGAIDVVAEHGYGGMSVARVTGRAGVSRRTFYDLFEDREDCFLAVFEQALARATRVAREAAAGETSWRARVRAGLSALLVFGGEEPVLTSLMIVDALGAGPRVRARRAQGLAVLIGIVERGRAQARPGCEPPPLTAEGVVGAVIAVLHARLSELEDPRLLGLLNPLMSMIVLPYLGRTAAARELAHPTPRLPRARKALPARDPLEGLGMRFTYRTLRVLSVVAEHPGSSNRQVADAAGIHDQGQISKLLVRLQHAGLVQNSADRHTRGEPNAWVLTRRGEEIETVVCRRGAQRG
jgi:AcrR family transcriptional regulator